MKIVKILIVIFLIGLTTQSLFAQIPVDPKNKTYVFQFDGSWWEAPVYCDGVEIDYLRVDNPKILWRVHFINGDIRSYAVNVMNGYVTSMKTGENFRLNGGDMVKVSEGLVQTHYNLIGDQGNHYIAQIVIDYWTWEFLEFRSVCVTNGK
jgi:uncharacterized protein affecting Mg2+/Co2+ transport